MSAAGFVLVGGRSTRMGRDKAFLTVGHGASEQTFVEHVAQAALGAVGNVTLVGAPERYQTLKYPVIPDRVADRGPLGGLFTALSATQADWNLILACDLPGITVEFLQNLLRLAEASDADCIVPSTWLSSLAGEFFPDTGLVAGYSPLEQRFPSAIATRWSDFFTRYLEVKNSLGAAAGIGLEHAYLCTGRNLAYRKSVFFEVGGFEKIKESISGDDDLFLQLVQRKTKWKIRYMLSPGSFVETIPVPSVRAFINQRKRHFSAAKYYPWSMKAIFALIHSFNVLSFVSLLVFPEIGTAALIGKFIVDGWFIAKGAALFGCKRLLRSFVQLEVAAVIYNSLIGPLGLFGTFSWKESKT